MTIAKSISKWLALAVVAPVLGLGGCAAHPDDIAPAQISDLQYGSSTCPELAKEEVRINEMLVSLNSSQRQTRIDDVYGYIFFRMPLGRMASRDLEAPIAVYKGERDAVMRMQTAKRCARTL